MPTLNQPIAGIHPSTPSTKHSEAIPGPSYPLPLPGILADSLPLLPLLRDPIGHMLHLQRTYGDIVLLSPGKNSGKTISNPTIFLFSPEYNRQLLSDQHTFFNGAANTPASPIQLPEGSAALRLFSGITTMNGAKHTQQRRLLMPAFHKKRIEALHSDMSLLINERSDQWFATAASSDGTIDFLREIKSLTLAVAVKTIFGLDPDKEGEHVRRAMERWLKLALSPSTVALPLDLPGAPFHALLQRSEQLEKEIRAMITRKRAALEHDTGETHADAMSLLLQAHDEDGSRLTDDELIGQATALFIAGHETTASALTWTLFFLMQHPHIYADLLAELSSTLHNSTPTVDQLSSPSTLPLLDAVIKESMRLIPPGLWFLRVATEARQFGPYLVPEGARLLWTPVVVHRDPSIYPEPNKFKPERWNSIDPSPYEYMPFGAGPRRCLGATFATMEMKLALPILLQRYRFQLQDGIKVDLARSPLASPLGGLPVKLGKPRGRLSKVHVKGSINKVVALPD